MVSIIGQGSFNGFGRQGIKHYRGRLAIELLLSGIKLVVGERKDLNLELLQVLRRRNALRRHDTPDTEWDDKNHQTSLETASTHEPIIAVDYRLHPSFIGI